MPVILVYISTPALKNRAGEGFEMYWQIQFRRYSSAITIVLCLLALIPTWWVLTPDPSLYSDSTRRSAGCFFGNSATGDTSVLQDNDVPEDESLVEETVVVVNVERVKPKPLPKNLDIMDPRILSLHRDEQISRFKEAQQVLLSLKRSYESLHDINVRSVEWLSDSIEKTPRDEIFLDFIEANAELREEALESLDREENLLIDIDRRLTYINQRLAALGEE